ncbi:arginine--tRNA ligase, partial [Patescibacteria group bacterium]|nr:arginine--tRNA ligase [Patescibacteria group bacterium]
MIRDQIRKLLNLPDAIIEQPDNKSFGDYSTNAVLKMAKSEGKNPLAMAQAMVKKLTSSRDVIFAKIEAAPPGFINFYLSPDFLREQVAEILDKKENYGASDLGQNRKVQVEFISANPTGPLTLGNGRGGVYGDVLGKILRTAGFDVTKEYYINDAGNQIEILMDTIREGKGDYIKFIREKFPKDVIGSDGKIIVWGQKGTEEALGDILKDIKKTVASMGIKFNVWFSERKELREKGKVEEIIKWLKEKDLAYEEEGALWFKATKFGDDKDRVLMKKGKDEKPTYFA